MDKTALLTRFNLVFTDSGLNARLKFLFEDGTNILVDSADGALVIQENDGAACDTEFRATYEHALAIFSGRLDPMRAILTRKLKASGDMGLALKLAKLLGGRG
jgi:putative sterol carrier protein